MSCLRTLIGRAVLSKLHNRSIEWNRSELRADATRASRSEPCTLWLTPLGISRLIKCKSELAWEVKKRAGAVNSGFNAQGNGSRYLGSNCKAGLNIEMQKVDEHRHWSSWTGLWVSESSHKEGKNWLQGQAGEIDYHGTPGLGSGV